jgi:hypothetical protein
VSLYGTLPRRRVVRVDVRHERAVGSSNTVRTASQGNPMQYSCAAKAKSANLRLRQLARG